MTVDFLGDCLHHGKMSINACIDALELFFRYKCSIKTRSKAK